MDLYLQRLGFSERPTVGLEALERLQRAHMTNVPFENLDVYGGRGVSVDAERSMSKIVDEGRGGWCFELNGSFALLLEELGFEVARLGAAVLLSGPTAVIDHLALEVTLDRPYLVDVGFGDSFIRPLVLTQPGLQDGGSGRFEFLASAEGTTLAQDDDGVPAAQYRFKRLTRSMDDFEPASQRLQSDLTLSWHYKAFATRLLDGGPDRVTLIGNELKVKRGGRLTVTAVTDEQWPDTLNEWFGFRYDPGSATRRL